MPALAVQRSLFALMKAVASAEGETRSDRPVESVSVQLAPSLSTSSYCKVVAAWYTVRVEETPTADTKTVCGLAAPSSAMDSVAPRLCAPIGRKATRTTHEADGASVVPEHWSAVLMKSSAPRK